MKVILIPFQVDSPLQLKDNVEKILQLIQEAIKKANIKDSQEKIKIVFPELTASTPDVGDDFYRILNEQIDALLNPVKKVTNIYQNASVYLGFPYIVNNNRHICHACIEQGNISFVRGKGELANNIKSVKNTHHESNPDKTTSAVGGGPNMKVGFMSLL